MKLKVIVYSLLASVFLNLWGAGIFERPIAHAADDYRNDKMLIPQGEKKMTSEANELLLFNFTSEEAAAKWRVINDTVMGGISSSSMERSGDGKAVFTGYVSLENNGGFASARSPKIKQSLETFTGIAIRVKGDGKKFKCALRTDEMFDGISHQAVFETVNGEWQVVKIYFADFVPTYHGRRLPEDKRLKLEFIGSVGFLISDKQMGPFRLEIDWIKAFK